MSCYFLKNFEFILILKLMRLVQLLCTRCIMEVSNLNRGHSDLQTFKQANAGTVP